MSAFFGHRGSGGGGIGGGGVAFRVWMVVCACVVGVWAGVWLVEGGGIGGSLVWWFGLGCGVVGAGIVFGLGRDGRLIGFGRRVCLWLAVVVLMGGYVGLRVGVVDRSRVDVLAGVGGGDRGRSMERSMDRAIVRVRGVVVGGVEFGEGRREVWEPVMWAGVSGRADVRVREVWVGGDEVGGHGGGGVGGGEWRASSGVVRVVMKGGDGAGIFEGDVVEVEGVLRGGIGRRNVGERDWELVGNMEGRGGVLSVVGGGGVEVVGRDVGVAGRVVRWRFWVRERALSALGLGTGVGFGGGSGVGVDDGDVGVDVGEGGAVLGALILGERVVGGDEVMGVFSRVGVGHVLAISGFHVGLLAGMCVFVVRVFGGFGRVGGWVGSRVWVEGLVVCGVLIGMWVLVPVRVPMVRAMVLIGAVMIGRGLGRRYDTMAVLGWVAVGLIVWRPMDVFGLGWQLSVGVTGLLVWMGRSDGGVVEGGVGRGWYVWRVLRVNFACWGLASGVILYHTGTVSVVGFVMAAVVAMMAGVLMVLGYGQVLIGVVSPGLGEETVWIVEAAAEMVAGFVGWVDGFGWSSVRGVNLGAAWTAGLTGLVWLVLTGGGVLRRRGLAGGWRWGRIAGVCCVLGVWGVVEWRGKTWVEGVRVEMLDVGDGSAYLVRSGGEAMLYDCGSLDFRVGRRVERAAWARGAGRIDVAIVSHDNVDHYNGLVELARRGVGFERVYIGEMMDEGGSDAWEAVRAELVEMGAEIVVMSEGDGFAFGEGRVVCVSSGGGDGVEGLSANDGSVVVRVEIDVDGGAGVEGWGERAVLFTGDIGSGGVGLIDDEDLEGVVVMEVPHHGAFDVGAIGLVERVLPGVVLQSTGVERVGDERWAGARRGVVMGGGGWYASGDRGGAWAWIRRDGGVESGWSVAD